MGLRHAGGGISVTNATVSAVSGIRMPPFTEEVKVQWGEDQEERRLTVLLEAAFGRHQLQLRSQGS